MKLKLAGLMLMAGAALFGQGNYGGGSRPVPGYAAQQNFRPELRGYYQRADRLRADMARDRFNEREARRRGDWRAANRFRDRLFNDQRKLDALLFDIQRREGRFSNDRRYDSYR